MNTDEYIMDLQNWLKSDIFKHMKTMKYMILYIIFKLFKIKYFKLFFPSFFT